MKNRLKKFIEKRVRLQHTQDVLQHEAAFYVRLGQQKDSLKRYKWKTQQHYRLFLQQGHAEEAILRKYWYS